MHGQIGGPNSRAEARGDLDFYYRTRAALLEARLRSGNGPIDYDFYRARACAERNRVRREMSKWLARFIRPLLAFAAIVTVICMMPGRAEEYGTQSPKSERIGDLPHTRE